jgi:hypothetical protein
VQDAGSYTYLRLRTASGYEWAAVMQVKVSRGMRVTIAEPAEMRDFESKALGRTFEVIYFGTVVGTDTAVRMPDGSPIQVTKADGADARTVAEVYAQSTALKDKPVVIKAQVASVSAGVLGKNWVHLRDGSGSTADRTFDVIALSAAAPKVGQVVTARGIVRTDLDLGMGHAFKVVIEDTAFAP